MMNILIRPIILFLSITLSQVCSAQGEDQNVVPPGTILLSGYKAISAAEELEKAKNFKASWDKYHQALRYYKSISNTHPTWNPHIVNGRIQSTTAKIDELTPLAQKEYLAAKAKVKDYTEAPQETSPNGIPSPTQGTFNSQETRQLTNINQNLNQSRKELETERLRNKKREQQLSDRISKVEELLRKSTQGINKPNSQVQILNGEIAKLQQELRRAKQLDQKNQSKLQGTITLLERKRAELAAAPLRKDVEKLIKANNNHKLEIKLLARKQKEKIAEIEAIQKNKLKIETDYKLLQARFQKNEQQLADVNKNTQKVVRALRAQNAALQKDLVTAQEKINTQQGQIKNLTQRLAESESISNELKTELANMTRERDQLSELLKLSDVDRGKQLMKENLRLARELQESKQSLAILNEDKNSAQDRVLQAENNVVIAKKQILDLREENISFKRRITQLEITLKDTKKQITKTLSTPQIDKLARAEAEELKKTIQRLMATQNRRKKAIAKLGDEYSKSGIKNAGFESSYKILTEENITLTDRERTLLAEKESDATFSLNNRTYADTDTRNEAKSRAEGKVQAYNSMAQRFIKKGQFKNARDIYDEAYDTTYDFSFLIYRSVVRLRIGDQENVEEALKILEDGVTTRPKSPYTHLMLGVARFQLQEDDLALKSLDTAINLQPDYPKAYTYRGIIFAEKSQFKQAEENFQAAIDLNPEFSDAHFNLSETLFLQNKKQKAKDAYADALRAGHPIDLNHEKKLGIKNAM